MNTRTSSKMKKYPRELPLELVTEVLLRLPVKSLVRFRCVCKGWFDLISSSDFVSLHLSRSHQNDDDALILAAGGDCQWMLISGLTYEKIVRNDYSILNNQRVMGNFCRCDRHGCSVNGLILFSGITFDPSLNKTLLELELWNPMIGKAHKIPVNFSFFHCVTYGFGFSRATNDYKVVAINHCNPIELVRVYSLSTRTWRRIFGDSDSIARDLLSDGDCLIDGKVHFLNYDEGNSHMAVFDVNDEEFSRIKLPYFMPECFAVAYHERIGLLDFDHEKHCCDLWVLEDDRAPGSWSKLYTMGFQMDPLSELFMVCFKKGEGFLFLTGKQGVAVELYNFKSGERKHLREISSYDLRYSTLYKESLVLL